SSYTGRTVMIDQADQYTDVPRSHWARQPVELMSHFAILSGRGNGEFDPDDPVLRKEFAKMVALTFELPLEGAGPSPFADAPNDWSQPYIDALYEAGLVQGEIVDGQRYFRPDRRISRAEAVTIIGRALDVDQTDISILPVLFLDDAEIPTWAMPSIAVLSVWRWISGFPDGEFHPHGELQRAQAAKILAHELGLVPSDVDSGAPRPAGFDNGWSHHLGGPERTSFSPGALTDAGVAPIWASNVWVEGGVAAGDGLLFIGATRGRVYALVPGSGGRIWQTHVDARADEKARLAYSPTHNLVYAAVFGQVAALHPVTGRKVWTYETPVLSVTRPVVAGARLLFAGHDPAAGRTLFALDAATGALLWKRPVPNAGTPAVSGDRLFVSHAGVLAAAYDVRDGSMLWQRERSDEPPGQYPPVVAHGLVFVVDTASQKLFALNEATGDTLWESTAHGPIAVDDRYVWAPQAGTEMLLLNPATGAAEATLDLCGTAPVIGATHAFVACEGNILAIDRTTLEIQPVAAGMQVLGLVERQVYYLTEDPSPISFPTLAALGAPDIPSPASALTTARDRAAATASFTRSSGTNGSTQP
ncbi:MAG: hypothetical protein K0R39_4181, partial [Symbiobacteriaceae bacterium]|nr:hypothetical protein [Symbiobacteriaceae bacterium]